MIKKITLENFQSHRNTAIEFSPGVNAIIGNSDSGKSALLRALYWVIQNKPSAGTFISHWAKDKDGKQLKGTAVHLEIGGQSISREKSAALNAYFLDGMLMEAVGRDVPEVIQKALNMTDVNIQKQLEAPFLLSESAGEVARFFNLIIKLDDIDKVLSAADSLKRQKNSDYKAFQTQQKELTGKLAEYDWIENARYTAEKLGRIEERLQLVKEKCVGVGKRLQTGALIIENLKKYAGLETALLKVSEIEVLKTDLTEKQAAAGKMAKVLLEMSGLLKRIPTIPDTTQVERALESTTDLSTALMVKKERLVKIGVLINNIKIKTSLFKESVERHLSFISLLPTTCPICGEPLKEALHG